MSVCAIVGAGPGVSLAVARRFGREGFSLALLARGAEKLQAHAAALREMGFEARAFPADAADSASVQQAFTEINAQMGEPDVLIYNAAAMHEGLPSELPVSTLMDDFRINVAGALLCAQQVIPAMRARQRGTILLTGGGLALHPMARLASLALGKAALRNLGYSLSEELEPHGIHVASVTITGFVRPGTHFDPDRIAETYWALYKQPPGQQEREIIYQ
jgi:short-subunit dehydrogenase